MKNKACKIMFMLMFCIMIVCICNASYAEGIVGQLSGMSAVSNLDPASKDTGILGAINSIIGILQYVGSGIALIVITILGIKYILASPSEKADVKKSIMPILIGCVLLFGGVNIAGIIVKFTNGAFK